MYLNLRSFQLFQQILMFFRRPLKSGNATLFLHHHIIHFIFLLVILLFKLLAFLDVTLSISTEGVKNPTDKNKNVSIQIIYVVSSPSIEPYVQLIFEIVALSFEMCN